MFLWSTWWCVNIFESFEHICILVPGNSRRHIKRLVRILRHMSRHEVFLAILLVDIQGERTWVCGELILIVKKGENCTPTIWEFWTDIYSLVGGKSRRHVDLDVCIWDTCFGCKEFWETTSLSWSALLRRASEKRCMFWRDYFRKPRHPWVLVEKTCCGFEQWVCAQEWKSWRLDRGHQLSKKLFWRGRVLHLLRERAFGQIVSRMYIKRIFRRAG